MCVCVCVCVQCHEKMTAVMKTEEGMGIEYDEDVVCDVCRSVSVISVYLLCLILMLVFLYPMYACAFKTLCMYLQDFCN